MNAKPVPGATKAQAEESGDRAIWRGMTRCELDRAYDNLAAVPDGATILQDYAVRSERLRRRQPDFLDLAYGPRPRNRIDLFRCGRDAAPLLAFIHGGYWQRNSKEMFACMAEGPLSNGFDVALIGYTLAPDATLSEIAAEICAAIRFLREYGVRYAVGSGTLVLAGWSAGAHLAATAMELPEVDAAFCISGIFDLEPCRLGKLNDKLNLTANEVSALSPMRNLPARAVPVALAYGTGELPELQRQSQDYHNALAAQGNPATLLPLVGANHFSILNELTKPDGKLTVALQQFVHPLICR
jgi:acetyl esterase/lipase